MNRLILIFFLAISSFSGFSQFDWFGSQDNDWNNGANWNTGFPPGSSTDNVTIQPGSQNWPIITSTVSCGDLNILINTSITVSTGTIEVFGNVMNQGMIIIGSGNFISNFYFNGNGGVIDFTDNGELTIKHESVVSFGDLDANFGTVNYHASGLPQSIEEFEIFANLKIDNAEGLQLNSSIEVNKAVDFANGLIYSSSSNSLKMNAFSYVAAVSNTSHVFGEMKKETNSTAPFTFPIGDGDNYMGLTITPATSNTGTYTAKYETSPHSSSSNFYPTTGFDHVSELYWWNLNGPNCDVGLNWNANSLVDDHTNIVLANYNPATADWGVAGSTLTSSNGGGSSTNSDGRVSSQIGNLGIGDFTLGSHSILPSNPFVHISNVLKTYVPDDNFEQYLETHDATGNSLTLGDPNSMGDGIANNDSVITSTLSGATWLDIQGLNIADITGIADFTSLTQLNCNDNLLTVVDFSLNTSIEEIYCDNNQIDSINVNSLTNLNTLTFNSNPLKYLNCANTSLSFLDFTSAPPLETLIATGCTSLTSLNVSTNNAELTNLQLTGSNNLNYIGCSLNSLTTLDLSGLSNLANLNCSENTLSSLVLSGCFSLTKINCNLNPPLSSLDLSSCSALTRLDAEELSITSLDLSNNSNLDTLNLTENPTLSSLDLTNNVNLVALDLGACNLTTLNLSANNKLEFLIANYNNLSYLDLRNGTNTILNFFNITNNSNLECVSVDNSTWSTNNWSNIDAQTFFSNNCAGIPVANFSTNQTSVCMGNSISFTDLTTNLPTSWSWDFGDGNISTAQSPTHTYLQPGIYTVILIANNANGSNTETKTAYITVYQNPLVSSITPTDINCFGGNNGAIDLTVSGGTSPYTFSWSSGETNQDISNLSSGTYSVTITDDNSCTADTFAIVNEPAAISISETIVNASCNASCDGSIDLSVTGGSSGYSFFWNTAQTTPNIANLCAGTYSVDVTDNNGCIASSSYTITEPTPVTVNAGSDITICDGNSVTLSGSGANSYTWDNGITDGAAFIPGLGITTYTVTGTGANGCTNTDQVNVIVNALPNVNAGQDTAICFGTTGTLSGSGANSYSWDNGLGAGQSHSVSPSVITTYIVTGTGANGCTNTDDIIVTVNALPNVNAGSDTTICDGNSVTLSGSGANSYSWNNSVFNSVPFNPTVGIVTYTVTGSDGNNCQNIDSITVFVNSNPVADAGSDITICDGSSIELIGNVTSGGNSPYNFSWNNGVTDSVSFVPPTGSNTTYTLTVTDLFLCSSTDDVEVISTPLPPVNAGNDFDVCPNQPVLLQGSGANFYSWNNNVSDGVPFLQGLGSTSYIVTGFSGPCANSDTVVVTVLPELVVDYQITHAECDSANGSVLAVVQNPTAPNYFFQWSNGDLDDFAEDLSAGPINIMISDVQCQYYDVVLIGNSNGGPVVNVNNVLDESCPGASDGEIQLIVTSSNPPYNVTWLCAEDDEYISNLPAGLYQYTVTDQSSCITSDFIHVNVPDSLEISSVSSTNPTCGLADGSISLGITGGSGTVNYSWSANASGQTGNSITGLVAGVYSVTISDGSSCSITEYFELNNVSSLAVDVSFINSPSCGNAGSINVFAIGGTSPYSYLWSNGDTTQNLNGIVPGNYSLALTDSFGCLAYFNQELLPENPFNPGICMVTVDSISENNIVIWEKPLVAGDASHYNIYRECCSSGLTNYLGTVPYDSLSEYMDTTCLPQSTNWSYQLSVVDTCGVESFKSAIHRSIHISSYLAANNTVGLYWNQYIGFPYATHYIYRNHPSTGMVLIDSVDYAITSYVDPNPIAPLNDLSYMIEVFPTSTCTSTKAVDHNSARSNRESGIVEPGGGDPGQSINQFPNGNLNVYPNPTNSTLALELNQIQLPCVIVLKDIQGRVVYSTVTNTNKMQLDLSSYEKGVYLIGVVDNNLSRYTKVIKN